MEKLSGWSRADVIGKLLVGEVFCSFSQLKSSDAMIEFMIVLHNALGGHDTDKFPCLSRNDNESSKLSIQLPSFYGRLVTEIDKPKGQPCAETDEFNLLNNMMKAVVEEDYNNAHIVEG